jgi:hypothetical protein
MEHREQDSEVIELGVVSADTKGSLSIMDDEEGGWKPPYGLCSD